MPETSKLSLLRCVAPSNEGMSRNTFHILIQQRMNLVRYARICNYDFDPSTPIVSTLEIRRPDNLFDKPLSAPFDHPELAKRIVLSRISMSVGCDPEDWKESEDPETDLMILLLAARRVANVEHVKRFVGNLCTSEMISNAYSASLKEMIFGVYVEAFP
ncbi:MAG: hypothetical protein EOP83_25440 [Verrucomicrobiaceae bacterium]|nr:MAG: hypothetical protein EOP83_25440 [Verrucomicrobiaceae bacterium]